MTKRVAVAFLLFLSGNVLRADFNFMVQGRLSDNTGTPIGTPTAVEWQLFRDGDPATCDASHQGSLAMTSNATLCACDTSNNWVIVNVGGACVW